MALPHPSPSLGKTHPSRPERGSCMPVWEWCGVCVCVRACMRAHTCLHICMGGISRKGPQVRHAPTLQQGSWNGLCVLHELEPGPKEKAGLEGPSGAPGLPPAMALTLLRPGLRPPLPISPTTTISPLSPPAPPSSLGAPLGAYQVSSVGWQQAFPGPWEKGKRRLALGASSMLWEARPRFQCAVRGSTQATLRNPV